MIGPIRFVFTILWFAIGLALVGELAQCTAIYAGKAASAQKHGISYGAWNRQLLGQRQMTCARKSLTANCR